LIDAPNLTKCFVELLVRAADPVFLFDEQPKQHGSPCVVRGVLKLAAKPPDILPSEIFMLVHETTQGCASSPYDHTLFPSLIYDTAEMERATRRGIIIPSRANQRRARAGGFSPRQFGCLQCEQLQDAAAVELSYDRINRRCTKTKASSSAH
jgi:hypothetical protein